MLSKRARPTVLQNRESLASGSGWASHDIAAISCRWHRIGGRWLIIVSMRTNSSNLSKSNSCWNADLRSVMAFLLPPVRVMNTRSQLEAKYLAAMVSDFLELLTLPPPSPSLSPPRIKTWSLGYLAALCFGTNDSGVLLLRRIIAYLMESIDSSRSIRLRCAWFKSMKTGMHSPSRRVTEESTRFHVEVKFLCCLMKTGLFYASTMWS